MAASAAARRTASINTLSRPGVPYSLGSDRALPGRRDSRHPERNRPGSHLEQDCDVVEMRRKIPMIRVHVPVGCSVIPEPIVSRRFVERGGLNRCAVSFGRPHNCHAVATTLPRAFGGGSKIMGTEGKNFHLNMPSPRSGF